MLRLHRSGHLRPCPLSEMGIGTGANEELITPTRYSAPRGVGEEVLGSVWARCHERSVVHLGKARSLIHHVGKPSLSLSDLNHSKPSRGRPRHNTGMHSW